MPLFVARHAARVDYAERDAGSNWTAKAERPWDPPLTAEGARQGLALGAGCAAAAQRLEVPPVTRVVSSPFRRCVQTAGMPAGGLGAAPCTSARLAPGLPATHARPVRGPVPGQRRSRARWASAPSTSTWS